jgi:hypothetical protein
VAALGSNSALQIVLALEYRKKSGRTIKERCTLDIHSGNITILDVNMVEGHAPSGIDFGTTFNLGITGRQKESKDSVVLPHFSAQAHPSVGANPSESAAEIEYTLDAEDDFDDEEDIDEDLLI